MRPLTLFTPKPLLKIGGRTILERLGDILPSEVDEVIMVVGYLADQIKNSVGTKFAGRPVTYVHQPKKLGTGHALFLCQPHLKGKFLLLTGDDLHGRQGLRAAVRYPLALVAAPHPNPERFGVLTVGADDTVAAIDEKPQQPNSNLVSTGALVLDERIFSYGLPPLTGGEHLATDIFNQLIKDHPVKISRTDFWFPIATPQDIPLAEELLSEESDNIE